MHFSCFKFGAYTRNEVCWFHSTAVLKLGKNIFIEQVQNACGESSGKNIYIPLLEHTIYAMQNVYSLTNEQNNWLHLYWITVYFVCEPNKS